MCISQINNQNTAWSQKKLVRIENNTFVLDNLKAFLFHFFKKGKKSTSIKLLNKLFWKIIDTKAYNTSVPQNSIKILGLFFLFQAKRSYVNILELNKQKQWQKQKQKIVPIKLKIQKRLTVTWIKNELWQSKKLLPTSFWIKLNEEILSFQKKQEVWEKMRKDLYNDAIKKHKVLFIKK